MNENRDLSCDRFVIQLDLTTSDAVADEVVELPFDAFPIFTMYHRSLESYVTTLTRDIFS